MIPKRPESKEPLTDKDFYVLLFKIYTLLQAIDKNTAVHQSPS